MGEGRLEDIIVPAQLGVGDGGLLFLRMRR